MFCAKCSSYELRRAQLDRVTLAVVEAERVWSKSVTTCDCHYRGRVETSAQEDHRFTFLLPFSQDSPSPTKNCGEPFLRSTTAVRLPCIFICTAWAHKSNLFWRSSPLREHEKGVGAQQPCHCLINLTRPKHLFENHLLCGCHALQTPRKLHSVRTACFCLSLRRKQLGCRRK